MIVCWMFIYVIFRFVTFGRKKFFFVCFFAFDRYAGATVGGAGTAKTVKKFLEILKNFQLWNF